MRFEFWGQELLSSLQHAVTPQFSVTQTKCTVLFILPTLSPFPQQLQKTKKYAKWKATYISGCLKRGETPHAGPLDEEGNEGELTSTVDH